MTTAWGTVLWDQQPQLERHTQEAIAFLSLARSVVSEIAAAEQDYGKAMRKIAAAHANVGLEDNTTCMAAFRGLIEMTGRIGQAHEQISSSLVADVCAPLKTLQKRKQQERTDLLKQAAALNSDLERTLADLDKVRKKYDKMERDEAAARMASDKAEETEGLAKAKQEKARSTWVTKAKAREAFEKTLRQETDQVNAFRINFYHHDLNGVFNGLQAMDEGRADGLAVNLKQAHTIYSGALSSDSTSAAALADALHRHDKTSDSTLVANRLKSGLPLPGPLEVQIGYTPRRDTHSSPRMSRSPRAQRAAAQQQRQAEEEEDSPTKAPPPPPSLNQCRALYAFAGSNDGELPVAEGETLLLVSNDGSGWVLCGKVTGEQGYVPQSYLQC